jgi:hypothetical protein
VVGLVPVGAVVVELMQVGGQGRRGGDQAGAVVVELVSVGGRGRAGRRRPCRAGPGARRRSGAGWLT